MMSLPSRLTASAIPKPGGPEMLVPEMVKPGSLVSPADTTATPFNSDKTQVPCNCAGFMISPQAEAVTAQDMARIANPL